MVFVLNTTYDEKEEAKRYGARWDREGRYWYYEGDSLPEELLRWYDPSSRTVGNLPRVVEHTPSRTVDQMIRDYHHVCWYPGAGVDFRETLFLSKWYYDSFNVPLDQGQVLPDLFVLTDEREPEREPTRYGTRIIGNIYYNIGEVGKSDAWKLAGENWDLVRYLYKGQRTSVTVKSIERAEPFQLEDYYTVDDYRRPDCYGNAFLMKVSIESKYRGDVNSWDTDILYVFSENAAFAKGVFIEKQIGAEYVVQVRTGTTLAREGWICALLDRLGTKYFIANEDYAHVPYPGCVDELNSFFGGEKLEDSPVTLRELPYRIDGVRWSDWGPVIWYRVEV